MTAGATHPALSGVSPRPQLLQPSARNKKICARDGVGAGGRRHQGGGAACSLRAAAPASENRRSVLVHAAVTSKWGGGRECSVKAGCSEGALGRWGQHDRQHSTSTVRRQARRRRHQRAQAAHRHSSASGLSPVESKRRGRAISSEHYCYRQARGTAAMRPRQNGPLPTNFNWPHKWQGHCGLPDARAQQTTGTKEPGRSPVSLVGPRLATAPHAPTAELLEGVVGVGGHLRLGVQNTGFSSAHALATRMG